MSASPQRELTVAFDAIGIKFMQLNAVVRDALIRKAILNGTEAAAAEFIALAIQSCVSHLIAIDALPPSDGLTAISRRGLDPVILVG